jgi:hypothetical protein
MVSVDSIARRGDIAIVAGAKFDLIGFPIKFGGFNITHRLRNYSLAIVAEAHPDGDTRAFVSIVAPSQRRHYESREEQLNDPLHSTSLLEAFVPFTAGTQVRR